MYYQTAMTNVTVALRQGLNRMVTSLDTIQSMPYTRCMSLIVWRLIISLGAEASCYVLYGPVLRLSLADVTNMLLSLWVLPSVQPRFEDQMGWPESKSFEFSDHQDRSMVHLGIKYTQCRYLRVHAL